MSDKLVIKESMDAQIVRKIDHKIKDICIGDTDALSISLDYDIDPTDMHPFLLYKPSTAFSTHYHIPLTKDEAVLLRDWLDDYLKDKT